MSRKKPLLEEIDRSRSEAERSVNHAQALLHNLYEGVKSGGIDKQTTLDLLVQIDQKLREVAVFGRPLDHFDAKKEKPQ